MSDPGATPTPAPAPTPSPAPSPAAPAAFDWSQHGLDADTTSYVSGKGWKSPADVVASYRGAEKLLGVPAEQVIKLPQGEMTQEQFTQIADRLGRPKEAAGYELGKLVPTGGDTKFADAAAAEFHKHGLTAKQAQELTKWWNGQAASVTQAQKDATAQRDSQQVSALKAEWGADFEAKAALVDKAAEAFGMKADDINALKAAMGPKGAMTFLHNIGTKLGVSDTFVDGEGHNPSFGGTPDQAKNEINALKQDKAFMEKYFKGDMASKQRMQALMARAYPGTISV